MVSAASTALLDDHVWAGLANAATNLDQSTAALTASQRGLVSMPLFSATYN